MSTYGSASKHLSVYTTLYTLVVLTSEQVLLDQVMARHQGEPRHQGGPGPAAAHQAPKMESCHQWKM